MLTQQRPYLATILILSVFALSSCFRSEDPGPLMEAERDFAIVDFDRLEMGSAFHITVRQGNFYSIHARGDRRNLDDLEVYKDGSTLIVRFESNRNRRHTTYLTITLPELQAANFSGASHSTISGFSGQEEFDFYLSGASIAQLEFEASEVDLFVSGASNLTLLGEGTQLRADLSGASIMNSFSWSADQVEVIASGASQARVLAIQDLHATASGASMVYYRGNPVVTANTSGASAVLKD